MPFFRNVISWCILFFLPVSHWGKYVAVLRSLSHLEKVTCFVCLACWQFPGVPCSFPVASDPQMMSIWSPVSFFLPRYPCWSTANGNKKPRKILLVGEVTPHRAKASLQELGKAAVTHFLTLVPMVCRDPQPEPHLPLTKNSPRLIPLCLIWRR